MYEAKVLSLIALAVVVANIMSGVSQFVTGVLLVCLLVLMTLDICSTPVTN